MEQMGMWDDDDMEQMGRKKLSRLYSSARSGHWLHGRAVQFERETMFLIDKPACTAMAENPMSVNWANHKTSITR